MAKGTSHRGGLPCALVTVLRTLLITVAVISVLFGVFYYSEFVRPFNLAKFDRSVWLSASGNHDAKNPRGPMAGDLRHRHIRKGMTRS